MKSNAFLPQWHIRDRRLSRECARSYRHRKNSQANSELQVEAFSRLLIIATEPAKSGDHCRPVPPLQPRFVLTLGSMLPHNWKTQQPASSTGDQD